MTLSRTIRIPVGLSFNTTTAGVSVVGLRFNPTEEELINYYLVNKITGCGLSEYESQFIMDINMYGKDATPWVLFSSDNLDGQSIPWQPSVDPSSKIKVSEQILYVLTELSSVGKTDKSLNRKKNRFAGCGTWHANNTKEPVEVFDRHGKRRVIGYRRSFTFRSSTHKTVGQWIMTEYSINAEAHGFSEDDCEDYVVCKIKRDDSKSSFDGKLVPERRKFKTTRKKKLLTSPSSTPSSSDSSFHRTKRLYPFLRDDSFDACNIEPTILCDQDTEMNPSYWKLWGSLG